MSVVAWLRRMVDRAVIARYRRSQITQQLIDERAELELDFAREHIIRIGPGI
jgi:hypothetical protein